MKPTMISNIYDQEKTLRYVMRHSEAICEPWCRFVQQQDIKQIYVIGSGTSYHAALVFQMYFRHFLHIDCQAMIPSILRQEEVIDPAHQYTPAQILVLGISQSGTSYSTVQALKQAQKQGYHTTALSQDTSSMIAAYADCLLPLLCEKEGIPIETRGYSVTILTGLLMALSAAVMTQQLTKEEDSRLRESIMTCIAMIPQIIEASERWYQQQQRELLHMRKAAICGSGFAHICALEASLKLYETFHQPVQGFAMEEMIHGYEMAFDQDQYIFYIAQNTTDKALLPTYLTFFDELHCHQFVITDTPTKRTQDLVLPACPNALLAPILYILPFQILAARNCEAIGYDTGRYPHPRKSFSHNREKE